MERGGTDELGVLARMENQWPDLNKYLAANFTLFNDGWSSVSDQLERFLNEPTL
jgi:hypothetical protein